MFNFVFELLRGEVAGLDDTAGIEDDVAGDVADAQARDQWRLPHAAVADGLPRQRVALDGLAALLGVGIETDADDGEAVTLLFLQGLQAALDIGAGIAPRRPDGDDIDLRLEVGEGHAAPFDVAGGEVGEAAVDLRMAHGVELLLPRGELFVVGVLLLEEGGEDVGLFEVGLRFVEEVTLEEIAADARAGVLVDECAYGLGDVGRHEFVELHAQLRHVVVVVGALDDHLLHVGGVTLDIDLFAGFGKDGLFGEVGEDDDEGGGMAQLGLVGEPSVAHGDGVDAADGSVGAVDKEFGLIDVTQSAGKPELVAVDPTGRQQQASDGEEHEGSCNEHGSHG